jgi:hypothetical protein
MFNFLYADDLRSENGEIDCKFESRDFVGAEHLCLRVGCFTLESGHRCFCDEKNIRYICEF